MSTTIQVTEGGRDRLRELRIHPRETYNDVIERILADDDELSEAALSDIQEALEDVRDGRLYSNEQVGRELGLD